MLTIFLGFVILILVIGYFYNKIQKQEKTAKTPKKEYQIINNPALKSKKVEFKVATSKPPISPPKPVINHIDLINDDIKPISSNKIKFTYQDAKGNITNREIRIDEVNDTYIEGYCYSAMDTRTFRVDRIVGLIEQNDEFYLPDKWLEKQGIIRNQTLYSTKYKPKNLEICFTGFSRHIKEELELLAEMANFTVRKTITKNLDFLVIGYNTGPSKINKAIDVGANLLDEDEFRAMLETGEIPQ